MSLKRIHDNTFIVIELIFKSEFRYSIFKTNQIPGFLKKGSMQEKMGFNRNIGLFMAVMIGIGAMMGPGIFALPGELAHMIGPLGVLVYLAMGCLTLFTALNYSELGAAIPLSGGGYSFVSKTLPKPVAFLTGWFLWIGNTVACAMYAIIFAITVQTYFAPGLNTLLITGITTIFFLLLNIKGMSESIKLISIMNIIELVILIGIASIGTLHINVENLENFAPKGLSPFLPSMALIYISYVGFDLITVASEEIINPAKTIPKAIFITLGVGIIIYVFVVGVMMAATHYTELGESKIPFIFLAGRVFGDWGIRLGILATVMASLSAFSVTLGASARILYALGRDKHIPSMFDKLHRKYKTPHIALTFCATVVFLFSATGLIRFVASVADFGYLMGLGIVNLSVIFLHKKMPSLRRPFKGPYFPWIPIIGALSCWVFVFALELDSLLLGLTLTFSGILIYFLKSKNRRAFTTSTIAFKKKLHIWIQSRRRKTMKILIIGGGMHGTSIARRLLTKDEHRLLFRSSVHEISFIEKSETACIQLEQRFSVPIFQGDGTKTEILEQVGLNNIDIVIAATDEDNQNVIASMQVKQLGVNRVFALIQDPDYLRLLDGHDITAISTPDASAVMIENLLERPGIAELFKLGEGQGSLAGICVGQGASVIGKKIHDIDFPEDCIVAALIREEQFLVPRGRTVIHENDHVLFVGISSAILVARKMFSTGE